MAAIPNRHVGPMALRRQVRYTTHSSITVAPAAPTTPPDIPPVVDSMYWRLVLEGMGIYQSSLPLTVPFTLS